MQQIVGSFQNSGGNFIASSCADVFVVDHTDDNDPLEEGWVGVGPGSGVTVGPTTDDQGWSAWIVDDNSENVGSIFRYEVGLSSDDVEQAFACGWRLLTRVRLADSGDGPLVPHEQSGSPSIGFRTGTSSWQMHFGTESDGDPIVLLVNELAPDSNDGIVVAAEGAGSGYHLYELTYDVVSQTAVLSMDGEELVSAYTPASLVEAPKVFWGANSSFDTGQGNFNLVSFQALCQAADFDGDGHVGPADLAQVLAGWGPCATCPADLTGDGMVGPADLAELLANWG